MIELIAYISSLATITYLKYIGKIMLESDGCWRTVFHNLGNVQNKWALLLRVLGR